MEGIGKKISAMLVACVVALSLVGGCAAQRKPLPPNTANPPAPSPVPAPAPNPNVQPKTPEQTRDTVTDLESRIEAVQGINDAYVVVLGNVAIVGLDIKNAKQELGTNQSKAEATRIAEADSRIIKAYVTADPDIIPRIREISQGIRDGRPVTEFLDEISEIMNRLAPSGDRAPTEPMS